MEPQNIGAIYIVAYYYGYLSDDEFLKFAARGLKTNDQIVEGETYQINFLCRCECYSDAH